MFPKYDCVTIKIIQFHAKLYSLERETKSINLSIRRISPLAGQIYYRFSRNIICALSI